MNDTPPLRSPVLDHVVWAALAGPQAHLSVRIGDRLRFHPDVAPFGALRPPATGTADDLAAYLTLAPSVAIVAEEGAMPFGAADASLRANVDQMVLMSPERLAGVPPVDARPLSADDIPDILALVQATKPGPFGTRTIEMGRYLGVRVDGRLVAMTGERMKVPGFTEVSAVCVDPSCRGRGYAASLMTAIATGILARGETPFLHVISENATAIALYERLGFRLRRRFGFSVFSPSAR